jgi:predicted glycogen debranching enzyme
MGCGLLMGVNINLVDLSTGRERDDQADAQITNPRLEWLVTNGLGGYAAGTLSGELTRSYHGWLVAALKPPLQRTLLLAKMDETLLMGGKSIAIHTNRWKNRSSTPSSGVELSGFYLEGTSPVWRYTVGDVLLEKRIWMEPGQNTTYIKYKLIQSTQPLTIACDVLVNDRSHHQVTRAAQVVFTIRQDESGLQISSGSDHCLHLTGNFDRWQPVQKWVCDYYLEIEAERGQPDLDNHYLAMRIEKELGQGDSFTITASSESHFDKDQTRAYDRCQKHEKSLIKLAGLPWSFPNLSELEVSRLNQQLNQLVLAADQFIVLRPTPEDSQGKTVIAGYPWFSDWGRDTMISLHGLTLATGRTEIAQKILLTFAQFVDQGMLPNRFPAADAKPEYNTVDATLWYFQAIYAYFKKSGDLRQLNRLYPILVDIIRWHQRGTRYQIIVDPQDGLLSAGETGVQLTWMDAKVGDWVVTPRIGKPVEINALWYNALCIMQEFAGLLESADQQVFYEIASLAKASSQKFWNAEKGYCYDVIDGPNGLDESLRPNQLLAISLPFSPLDHEQARQILEICTQKLLTPFGLRSLAEDDLSYTGVYTGDRQQRDSAYHQGTVWGWMIGPYVTAILRYYQDPTEAVKLLAGLSGQLSSHCVGTLSEIFDGDPPYTPRGCYAQAWTVAEVLRCLEELHNFSANISHKFD